MDGLWIVSYVVLWLIVCVQGVMIVALLRLAGEPGLRLSKQGQPRELTKGSHLLDRTIVGLNGERSSLSALWRGERLLLFFTSVECPPCRDLLSRFATLYDAALATGWRACVLCVGKPAAVQELVDESGLPASLLIAAVDPRGQDDLARAYGLSGTPTLVAVDGGGHVQSVIVGPVDDVHLRQLIAGPAMGVFAA